MYGAKKHIHTMKRYAKGYTFECFRFLARNTDIGDIADPTIHISELYIPDTVTTIYSSAFTPASAVDTIYDFF